VPEDRSKAEILEAAAKAQAEAERKAREASIAREQAEAERKAAENRVREEKERARLAEERAKQIEQEASKVASLRSIQPIDDTLSIDERMLVQRRLQELKLYPGRLDAIFGQMTREAIRDFQKLTGAPETGYLTRGQFEQLVNLQ
jgi:Putative peptidoglycan binding domain